MEVYLLMPMACPVCQFTVTDLRGLASHFRHQAATHPDYTTWADDRKEPLFLRGLLARVLRAPLLDMQKR